MSGGCNHDRDWFETNTENKKNIKNFFFKDIVDRLFILNKNSKNKYYRISITTLNDFDYDVDIYLIHENNGMYEQLIETIICSANSLETEDQILNCLDKLIKENEMQTIKFNGKKYKLNKNDILKIEQICENKEITNGSVINRTTNASYKP